ncbi:hypothetical protein NYE37_03880 [Thermoactinomyces sp. FSL K6-2592]|jgi:hypothetical protein|uniref:hypothetical protein n=1 Tax=Thermoactinomyces sp. FSL K6-2592 TaxID=2975347 RepID=UPI0030F4EAB9
MRYIANTAIRKEKLYKKGEELPVSVFGEDVLKRLANQKVKAHGKVYPAVIVEETKTTKKTKKGSAKK